MTSIQSLFKLLIYDINLPTINAPYQGHTTILTAIFTDILNNKWQNSRFNVFFKLFCKKSKEKQKVQKSS